MNKDNKFKAVIFELGEQLDDCTDELSRATQILRHIVEDYEDSRGGGISQVSINEAKRFLGMMK